MDLHLLRSFVAVAEEEHLARAGARLHISPSPLSRQIRALEASLGLVLFTRERQRLRLTDAGRWMLEQAKTLVDDANRVRREAEDRAQGHAGAVVVGFVSAAMWSDVLPDALRAFHRARPGVRVELRHRNSSAQIEAVRAGRLDLAFVHTARDERGLTVRRVSVEPFLLALPRTHPLARRPRVAPADLDGVRWITLAADVTPRLRDRMNALGAALGFTPDVVYEATDLETMLRLVEAGLGAAVLPAGTRQRASKAVVFRDVPWLDLTATLYLVAREAGRSPAADLLASMVPDV